MDLDQLWTELEARLPPGAHGQQRQGIHPEAPADLYASVIAPGPLRALQLVVKRPAGEDIEDLPTARGVVAELLQDMKQITIELRLTDPSASDLFTALATNVADAAAGAPDDEEAVRAFLGRLARWMQLLQRNREGLSREEQRGLYGELWFLREHLIPRLGLEQAISAWQAPFQVPHDFQTHGGAVEMKTSVANQPQIVRINGERQLDDSGVSSLHLVHLSLDLHHDAGETLPAIVQSVRELVSSSVAGPVFEDRLFESRYVDVHEPLYRHTGYTLREMSVFEVRDGFPRIIEADLVDGVGRVHYKLAIAACSSFRVADDGAVAALVGGVA
jgi:Putative  PD-(D/E)XK family member, (DUF4420)